MDDTSGASARFRWLLGAFAAAVAVVALGFMGRGRVPTRPPGVAPVPLRAGSVVTARIGGGQVHPYTVDVPAGFLLHLKVEQREADVVLTLHGPNGEPALVIDSPNRASDLEECWWFAPEAGRRRVEVRSAGSSAAGSYRLRVLSIAPARPEDRLRLAAQRQAVRAGRLLEAGDPRGAVARFAVVRGLWRRLGERGQEALTLLRIAEAERRADDLTAATGALRQALGTSRAAGNVWQEAGALMQLGETLRVAGDLEGAWQVQSAALGLARHHGWLDAQAQALANLAAVLDVRGEARAALEHHRQALAVSRRLGNRRQIATALDEVGTRSSRLGLLPEAEGYLAEAILLFRAVDDKRNEGGVLTELGWIYRLRARRNGDAALRECARGFFEQALACRRAAGYEVGEAGTLDRLGTLLRDGKHWDEAQAAYERSFALLRRHPSGRRIAHSLNNQAELQLDRGNPAKARALAARALAEFRALPEPELEGEAYARFLIGRAAAGLGREVEARRELGHALDRFEALRSSLGNETLTASFFALRQIYFEGAIEAWMALDARRPGEGFAADALAVAERAHMRTLIDGIALQTRRNRGAVAPDDTPALSVDRIQGEMLDRETLLLEYAVGEKGSHLWIVGRGGFTAHALPERAVLDPLVREAYKGLVRKKTDPEPLRRLAIELLEALGDRPGIRRLAVVSDGPLAFVPFAVLPWGPLGRPLAERYEIVRVPSASTLLALRHRRAAAPAAKGPTAAILADPVFTAYDSRVGHDPVATPSKEPEDRADLTRAVRGLNLKNLGRLPATRREARVIADLAPDSLVELDFSAARDALDRATVRRARILHLATHALVSADDPAATGIVLSLVDAEGRQRPGFLRLGEIAGLDLEADLVVLSACETAIGPDVPGEGLMGLSRAFLHAGARQVVASLWNVDDEASATFMTHFYQGLLRDHLQPAAALRRAQLSVRAEPRTAHPYFWAGFELQGDWP